MYVTKGAFQGIRGHQECAWRRTDRNIGIKLFEGGTGRHHRHHALKQTCKHLQSGHPQSGARPRRYALQGRPVDDCEEQLPLDEGRVGAGRGQWREHAGARTAHGIHCQRRQGRRTKGEKRTRTVWVPLCGGHDDLPRLRRLRADSHYPTRHADVGGSCPDARTAGTAI